MLFAICIRNFRAFKDSGVHYLSPFHILAGPNSSGKSTFFDAIDFVRDCLRLGPKSAVEIRVPDFDDLTSMREGGLMSIILAMKLPCLDPRHSGGFLSYILKIGRDDKHGVRVHKEELKRYSSESLRKHPRRISETLVKKTSKNTDFFQREDGAYKDSFAFGMDKLALAMTPADETRYPTANAVKRFLTEGIRYIQLNSRAMRMPCPATKGVELELDGSNLARVVGWLKGERNGKKTATMADSGREIMERWTQHLRYALPDLEEIGWGKREADNAEYITLKYANGLKCPSWLVSDGTLRMLALTLPAFLPPKPAVYMVEEPENGVHPKALEIILRSLSTIPNAQTFVATHSPLAIQQMGRDSLLCFSKDEKGVKITPGKDHPSLKDWDGTPDLATIFSAGVLG